MDLDFTKLTSRGHVTVLWAPTNAFAVPEAPTTTELNALLNMSKSISWNDWGFGIQASNTNEDPSLADVGQVETRGASNYGGEISFYYPSEFDDNSNNHSLTFDAVGTPRTEGYIVVRIDGDKKTTTAFADGDYLHVAKVRTAGYGDSITGEEAFRYTVNFLKNGFLAVNTIARTSTVTVEASVSTVTGSVGKVGRITATANGRPFTGGLKWTSSDPSKVAVDNNGVYQFKAAGSATITCTFEATGASDTVTCTVS